MGVPALTRALAAAWWCARAVAFALPAAAWASNPAVTVVVDVDATRRPISPLIYGVNWGSTRQLLELNAPLNRQGGNSRSRYNWKLNASNRGRDWYFQSSGEPDATPGEFGDTFIRDSRAAGAEPMLTIPLLGWVAKLGPERGRLASYSIAKYGPQTGADERWFPDAGNGIRPDGSLIVDNDPSDANVRADVEFQRGWVAHLVAKWGGAAAGGLRYYILDNEPSIWHSTHRDVQPVGLTMSDLRRRIIAAAAMIKDADPDALVVAPEEWGWTGFFRSGFDQQWGGKNGWRDPLPDRAAHGDQPYIPWLLDQLRREHERTGRRLLDVLGVHFYPQGGESSDDVGVDKQRLRARSTRSLWDPRYRDESWIDDYVRLIPRLREWVDKHYPGTAIGITEYDWGAEWHVSGAIAQADVLGIFGREGVDLAARWEAPAEASPVFNAFKLYRNYDGRWSTFGDVSVGTTVPNPDVVAAFAAERTRDGALTVMVLAKHLAGDTVVTLDVRNYPAGCAVPRWQLDAGNAITPLPPARLERGRATVVVPAQSITLLVLGRQSGEQSC